MKYVRHYRDARVSARDGDVIDVGPILNGCSGVRLSIPTRNGRVDVKMDSDDATELALAILNEAGVDVSTLTEANSRTNDLTD